ncbi:Outer membrane efflux protein [Stieleria bergensis]|uniref:Outer membrane efflux protein n=1 Tax=Stieleria bergensis TaxID=2528025 RepID=A0A517SZ68_9BACT|nr:Outer membrane efflux protein [Planctomycetes bacterium SV_7m_r]
MARKHAKPWIFALLTVIAVGGCASKVKIADSSLQRILSSQAVKRDSGQRTTQTTITSIPEGSQPFTVTGSQSANWKPPQRWSLTIDEAVQIALSNSTVLRDLGARVIQTPGLTPTIYGPAIQATNPTGGVEAALSAFDAQVDGELVYEDNDRVLNNEFIGGGVNFYRQQLTSFENSLSKRTALGTQYTLRHIWEGDLNNADRNLLPGRAWAWNFEAEVSQPLLQGRGADFNRIAGPNSIPGTYSGVVIARLNADVTVTQLEIALRDFLTDVENAYWDLHFAYQDLEIKKSARDRSLNTYQLLKAREGLLMGAEKDKVAQAREQYFRFEQDVQDALAGRLVTGTRAFNGSAGGTFQGVGGVYVSERRLRMIMGLPINDGRLINPSSGPSLAPIAYDWDDLVTKGLTRRTELRKQRLIVDKSLHELNASRNFLLPRLDIVGRYRFRALGDGLYDHRVDFNGDPVGTGTHEWMAGLSYNYAVGMRQANSAVRNAQLTLSRERAMLGELERQVVFGVSNAVAETDRAFSILRTALNREDAAREQYDILSGQAQEAARQFDFNSLLDSERRLADASNAVARAQVQYALSVKNLNFETGTLMEFYNIHMSDRMNEDRNVILPTGGTPTISVPTQELISTESGEVSVLQTPDSIDLGNGAVGSGDTPDPQLKLEQGEQVVPGSIIWEENQ